jgi:hypothetical protein
MYIHVCLYRYIDMYVFYRAERVRVRGGRQAMAAVVNEVRKDCLWLHAGPGLKVLILHIYYIIYQYTLLYYIMLYYIIS